MSKLLVASCFLFAMAMIVPATARAASPEVIPLWPNGAPGEKGPVGPEHDHTTSADRQVAGQRVIRLTGVSAPTITVYQPRKSKATGTAVLICPGGGYQILAMDLEGTEVAKWFNSLGVTAAVLKYRVPNRSGDVTHMLPLQDAQRALGLMRYHALDWHIDPARIGVLGFSAGGHLNAHLCGDNEKRAYPAVDAADETSCRPDFSMLIYPAYLVKKADDIQLVPEIMVSSNNPPTFLVQTEDDAVFVQCGLDYYRALKNNHVPAEMHLYASGGHGYGLRPSGDLVSTWPKRAEEWMRSRGLLEKKKP